VQWVPDAAAGWPGSCCLGRAGMLVSTGPAALTIQECAASCNTMRRCVFVSQSADQQDCVFCTACTNESSAGLSYRTYRAAKVRLPEKIFPPATVRQDHCRIAMRVALRSRCPSSAWHDIAAPMVLRADRPMVLMNVGCNKGYNLADYYARYGGTSVNASVWHGALLRYDRKAVLFRMKSSRKTLRFCSAVTRASTHSPMVTAAG